MLIMKPHKLLLLSLFCFSMISSAAAPLKINRLPGSPVIDGSGKDDAWNAVSWNGNFRILGKQTAPEAATEFKIGCDDDFIYLLINAREPEMDKLQAKRLNRDDPVFWDDALEIDIDPDGAGENIVQFTVNTVATVFDSRYTQGGLAGDRTWNCSGFKAAVEKSEAYYQLEAAIPLGELGRLGKDGRFRFNIGRHRFAGRREISSFSPVKDSFQEPADYTEAILEHPDIQAFFWECSAPFDLKFLDGGQFSGKIQVVNKTGSKRFFSIAINGEKPKQAFLDTGKSRDFPFTLPFNEGQKLQVELKEKKHTRFLSYFPIALKWEPLKITLTNPPYRDAIFSDQNLTELAGIIETAQVSLKNTPVKLTLHAASGELLGDMELPSPGTFHFPLPPLQDGTYTIKATCGTTEAAKILRKLPRVQGEVRFTENKVMLIDGTPRLPYGWFRLNHKDGSRDGYLIDVSYNAPWQSDGELQAVLDQAAALGIKVITYCYPKPGMMNNAEFKKLLSQKDAEDIRNRVRKFSSHPGLLGWYLADEPEYEPWSRERLEQVYAICRENDPWHPAVIVNNSIDGMAKYAGIGDISMPDYYPLFKENGGPVTAMERCTAFFRSSVTLDNRIQWATPQAFSASDYVAQGHRAPDYTEMRNMQYQALIAGMTGIVWYSHELNYTRPEIHLGVRSLLNEAKALNELWFRPECRRMVDSGDPKVLCAVWSGLEKGTCIAAVNTDGSPRKISLPAQGTFHAAGENLTPFETTGGILHDTLQPCQVRIYVTDKALAHSFSCTDFIKDVPAAQSALWKKGNLAYCKSADIRYEHSALLDPRYPLAIFNDGTTARMRCFDRTADPACRITLIFPSPVTFNRLKLYGREVKSYQVSIPGKKLAAYSGGGTDKYEETQVILDKTAVSDRVTVENFRGFGIMEIELYND